MKNNIFPLLLCKKLNVLLVALVGGGDAWDLAALLCSLSSALYILICNISLPTPRIELMPSCASNRQTPPVSTAPLFLFGKLWLFFKGIFRLLTLRNAKCGVSQIAAGSNG